MNMNEKFDVTIVGGGIIGICSALSLQERGINVRLIDSESPGQTTSFGNAGVISPWSIIPQSKPGLLKNIPKMMFSGWQPLSIRAGIWASMIPWGLKFLSKGTETGVRQTAEAMSLLCTPSIELYRKHFNNTGHERLVKDTSYLQLIKRLEDATLDDLANQIRLKKGANIEIIKGSALRTLEPALSSNFKAGIVIYNTARTISPGRLGAVLAEKAQSQGAKIIKDEINQIGRDRDNWFLEGKVCKYDTKLLVIAAGAWSKELLSSIGVQVPLITERGYHIHCTNPGIEVKNSVVYSEGGVIASSMEGGVRIAGQVEFGPIDAPLDPKREFRLKRIAHKIFPDISLTKTKFWMGRRPSFPDSLPVIGKVPKQPGLFVNFGHSHHGLMMAPKSGDVLANTLMQNSINEDVSSIFISRFMS
jgi:D-amino-acid dehydrogenase